MSALKILLVAVILAMASPSFAQNRNPLDWSEYMDRLWPSWPLDEIEFWVEQEGFHIYQYTSVSESPQEVYEKLHKYQVKHKSLGNGYYIVGSGVQENIHGYIFTIGKKNLMLTMQVKPDDQGSLLILESTPHALPNGFFKKAMYPYRLGHGQRVTTRRIDGREM